jgi:hypothetical protein
MQPKSTRLRRQNTPDTSFGKRIQESNVQVFGDSTVVRVSQLINITSGVSLVSIVESFINIQIQSQVLFIVSNTYEL